MKPIEILRTLTTKENLLAHAALHGDMAKVVVDIARDILAIGGEMHADEEQLLLQDGSVQGNLWGANVYPDRSSDDRIEFTSLINIRPRSGNRSMEISDIAIQQKVQEVIDRLIP
ncbi:MAG: DUF5674 family protein [bacterium]|nr:DUF5674 family protein [bacterium]